MRFIRVHAEPQQGTKMSRIYMNDKVMMTVKSTHESTALNAMWVLACHEYKKRKLAVSLGVEYVS